MSTAEMAALSSEMPTEKFHAPLTAASRERCPMCAAGVAADQRYCVECGHRLGLAKPPLMEAAYDTTITQAVAAPPAASGPARRLSADTTMIAGVATLLLAMGIGVMIGRASDNGGSKKAPTAQVITVAGAGGAAAASAPATTTPTTAISSKSTTTKPSKTSAPPPKAVVKIGQKGAGPGYQNGKFTGNFFGN